MRKSLIILTSFVLSGLAAPATATVTWNWSFGGEAGTFTTDGNAVGSTAAAGTYNLSDFSVISSAFGRPIGSISGGQYVADGFDTYLPYAFNWNGSSITLWDSAGLNTFNWWVFGSVADPTKYHFFGWNAGNINDVGSAALFEQFRQEEVVGPVTVAVASVAGPVPEAATWAMMLLGFGSIGYSMRRKREHRVTVSYN